jgi:hypothetical protein
MKVKRDVIYLQMRYDMMYRGSSGELLQPSLVPISYICRVNNNIYENGTKEGHRLSTSEVVDG